MKFKRLMKWLLLSLLALVVLMASLAGLVWWYFHPTVEHLPSVTYLQSKGHALKIDVLRPTRPNGLGVMVMLSGRWQSSTGEIAPYFLAPLLRRGYTILSVHHGSQPEFTVMEIVDQVIYAVRYIRNHAREWAIDPQRLAVTGGSSGGHLSLMIAVRGGPGRPEAEDPVERESNAVQAVACFYPPTDLLNLGKSTENPGDGGPPKSFVKAFGPQATNLAAWKKIGHDVSPIYHIHSNLPPVLIIHGDADTLVPVEQSEWFQKRAQELGCNVQLIVRPGKPHGWLTMLWDIRLFADWFDQHLK